MVGSRAHDVVIVGAGPAGITAAIALARAGRDVVVVEGAVVPGAENWSGAVYFTENLTRLLGREAVESLPFERRVVRRSLALTDGVRSLELAYGDRPDDESPVFDDSYVVLRPVFDRALAELAHASGATILSGTTASGLLRRGGRIQGVETSCGILRARCVFLAEGDAGHLMRKEGLDIDGEQPSMLHGVKEVITLDRERIDERFALEGDAGACLEILLRNPTLEGRTLQLSAGGFLYTNADSISLGIVLPLENLRHIGGDYNRLIEWYKRMPLVHRLIEGGQTTAFGARVIRGGGIRQVPRRVLDGLAVGGAAAGLGVDLPYPNYTGPATASGLLFAEAFLSLENDGVQPTAVELERRYLQPLERTRYWGDMQHLESWPHYVETTRAFFGAQIDVACQTLGALTDENRGTLRRIMSAPGAALAGLPRGHRLGALFDLRRGFSSIGLIGAALGALPRAIPFWFTNLLSRLGGGQEPPGELAVTVRGEHGEELDTPRPVRWLSRRLHRSFQLAMAEAYRNDDIPLSRKLPRALDHALGEIDIVDATLLGLTKILFFLAMIVRGVFGGLWAMLTRPSPYRLARLPHERHRAAARAAGDLGGTPPAVDHDAKLALVGYRNDPRTHIRISFPHALLPAGQHADPAASSLWSVCPAKVYQKQVDSSMAASAAVLYENCVKCETCLFAEPDQVDWTRFTGQRMVYPATSSRELDAHAAVPQLSPGLPDQVSAVLAAGHPRRAPHGAGGELYDAPPRREASPEQLEATNEIARATRELRRRCRALIAAVERAPSVAEAFHLDWITRLADLVAATAARLARLATPAARSLLEERIEGGLLEAVSDIQSLGARIAAHAGAHHGFNAAADAWQLIDWRLLHLERALRPYSEIESLRDGEVEAAALSQREPAFATVIRETLEGAFDRARLIDLEHGAGLTDQEHALLGALIENAVGAPAASAATLLVETGRIDLGLGMLLTSHLAAATVLDRAKDQSPGDELEELAGKLAAGDRLAATLPLPPPEAAVDGVVTLPHALVGQAEVIVLITSAGAVHALPPDHQALETVDAIEPTGIGLRSARPREMRVRLEELGPPLTVLDGARDLALVATWRGQLAIALGATEALLDRAVTHAMSRVQFPDLFRDRRGRDGIVKFGAVRAMIAGISANRFLLETLVFCRDLEDDLSLAALDRIAGLDAHGPRTHGSSYLAGQVTGGMAYSEDDNLARHYRDASALQFVAGTQAELGALAGDSFLGLLAASEEALGEEQSRSAARALEGAGTTVTASLRRASIRLNEAPAGDPARAAAAIEVGLALAAEAAAHSARRRARALASLGCAGAEIADAAASVLEERAAEAMTLLHAAIESIPGSLDLGRHLLAEGCDEQSRPPAGEVKFSYESDLLDDGGTYDSGTYLFGGEIAARNRLTPESTAADPRLHALRSRLRQLFLDRFRGERPEPAHRKRFGPDHLPYQRWLDRIHHVPQEDLDWLAENGFYRTFIPKELGGEGRLKIDYYEVCRASMRYPDPAVSLTIQANASIGTSPILIGLKHDLAAAERELQDVLDHPERVERVQRGLEALTTSLDSLAVLRAEAAYIELRKQMRKELTSSRAARSIFRRTLSLYDAAGLEGRRRDMEGFRAGLQETAQAISDWQNAVHRALSEMPSRRTAHEFFLRWIAWGRISAFGLTEPSSGSDTARIRTRARPASLPLTRDGRGFYTFDPGDGRGKRVMADMRRFALDASTGRVVYRLGFDEEEGRRVPVDILDHSTSPDQPRHRFIEVLGERIDLHDLGLPRREEQSSGGHQEHYDFYEIDGSKMWITNGHIAGVFCVYVRTRQGITGMMMDGQAEGLVIGKDEEKMGQRGGPTNELTMTRVRIPRACVIGLEGRGQENALETLNVGRAGLLISTVAVLSDLVDDARADLPTLPAGAWLGLADKDAEAAQPYWLGRFAIEHFACESLAANLVGYVDHPGVRSARMESAIGKYFGGESLHRILDQVEHAYGAAAPSSRHDVEKKRRDARIINIYEGTNEVQRFLVLKDLVTTLKKWQPAPTEDAVPADTLERVLLSARERLHELLVGATKAWGDRVWQSVRHQPIFFRLAEMAGWICVADAVLHRRRWAIAHVEAAADRDRLERLRRAAAIFVESLALPALWRQAGCFELELEALAEGREPPILRLADLTLEAHERAEFDAATPAMAELETPASTRSPHSGDATGDSGESFEITVAIAAAPVLAPHPRLAAGRVLEPWWELDAPSRAALAAARQIAALSERSTRITAVAAGGGRATARALRLALAAGADQAVWLTSEHGVDHPTWAAAMAGYLSEARGERHAHHRSSNLFLAGDSELTGGGAPALVGGVGRHTAAVAEAGGMATILDACEEIELSIDGERVRARGVATGGAWVERETPVAIVVASAAVPELAPVSAARQVWAEREELVRVAVTRPGWRTQPVGASTETAPDHDPVTGVIAGDERFELPAAGTAASATAAPSTATPEVAAARLREELHLEDGDASPDDGAAVSAYTGPISRGRAPFVQQRMVLALGSAGELDDLAAAARGLAHALGLDCGLVLWSPGAGEETLREQLAAGAMAGVARVLVMDSPRLACASVDGASEALARLLPPVPGAQGAIALLAPSLGGVVAELAGARLAAASRQARLVEQVTSAAPAGSKLAVIQAASGGRLRASVDIDLDFPGTTLLSVTGSFQVENACAPTTGAKSHEVVAMDLDLDYDALDDVIAQAIASARTHLGIESLAEAEFIIDIGFGVASADGLEIVLPPLEAALERAGVKAVMVGATRKVTQDLGLLPDEKQIGQTGVSVDPRIVLAIGVSGAPQHIDYIGERAVIMAFNHDTDAPLCTLNQRQARPVVIPIPGDLFETVPRFIAALQA